VISLVQILRTKITISARAPRGENNPSVESPGAAGWSGRESPGPNRDSADQRSRIVTTFRKIPQYIHPPQDSFGSNVRFRRNVGRISHPSGY
jgi:hypothetical protein